MFQEEIKEVVADMKAHIMSSPVKSRIRFKGIDFHDLKALFSSYITVNNF